MLYLLDKEVQTVKWNGIPLYEAVSARVKETLNGDFTLTLKYPITDSHLYRQLKVDKLIKAPVPELGEQLFRIMNMWRYYAITLRMMSCSIPLSQLEILRSDV